MRRKKRLPGNWKENLRDAPSLYRMHTQRSPRWWPLTPNTETRRNRRGWGAGGESSSLQTTLGCAAFSRSCLQFLLRPNKSNFTTALTWSEPENGPTCPENLSAGSYCHFSQKASVELHNMWRTPEECKVQTLSVCWDKHVIRNTAFFLF